MSEKEISLFHCTTPCGNCPYRTDAPRRLWAKEEFEDLLMNENSQFNVVYKCHKNNGGVCVGWLVDQYNRGVPSISLRIARHPN